MQCICVEHTREMAMTTAVHKPCISLHLRFTLSPSPCSSCLFIFIFIIIITVGPGPSPSRHSTHQAFRLPSQLSSETVAYSDRVIFDPISSTGVMVISIAGLGHAGYSEPKHGFGKA